jgi:hypothetical protein
MLKRELQ